MTRSLYNQSGLRRGPAKAGLKQGFTCSFLFRLASSISFCLVVSSSTGSSGAKAASSSSSDSPKSSALKPCWACIRNRKPYNDKVSIFGGHKLVREALPNNPCWPTNSKFPCPVPDFQRCLLPGPPSPRTQPSLDFTRSCPISSCCAASTVRNRFPELLMTHTNEIQSMLERAESDRASRQGVYVGVVLFPVV